MLEVEVVVGPGKQREWTRTWMVCIFRDAMDCCNWREMIRCKWSDRSNYSVAELYFSSAG